MGNSNWAWVPTLSEHVHRGAMEMRGRAGACRAKHELLQLDREVVKQRWQRHGSGQRHGPLQHAGIKHVHRFCRPCTHCSRGVPCGASAVHVLHILAQGDLVSHLPVELRVRDRANGYLFMK